MTIRCYREWTTELLLTLKTKLEFEASNWTRRIGEIESGIDDASFYPPISEYQSRIRECKKHLRLINRVLKEREVISNE